MRLCRKIIEFIRLSFLNDADQIGRVRHVPIMQHEPLALLVRVLVKMINPVRVKRRSTTLDPVNLVTLIQQKLSEILNMNFYQQKNWLRSIRAARGISENPERQMEQISDDIYEPERKFLQQWMATGRY